jgi:hypothetical protein
MLLSYVCCRTLFFSFANQTHVAYKLVREYVKDQMKNILASLFVLTLAISNVVLAKGGGGGGGGGANAGAPAAAGTGTGVPVKDGTGVGAPVGAGTGTGVPVKDGTGVGAPVGAGTAVPRSLQGR